MLVIPPPPHCPPPSARSHLLPPLVPMQVQMLQGWGLAEAGSEQLEAAAHEEADGYLTASELLGESVFSTGSRAAEAAAAYAAQQAEAFAAEAEAEAGVGEEAVAEVPLHDDPATPPNTGAAASSSGEEDWTVVAEGEDEETQAAGAAERDHGAEPSLAS